MMKLNNDDEMNVSYVSRICGPTMLAWFSMVLAVLSGATVGPVFKYMGNFHIQPCMSASWRGQSMVIFLLPLAILEHYFSKSKESLSERWLTIMPDSTLPVIGYVCICGLGWSGSLLLWIIGLRYTTTVKASILACVHPLMLVIYLKCVGKRVSALEWAGVCVVLSGLVVSASLRKQFSYYLFDHSQHHQLNFQDYDPWGNDSNNNTSTNSSYSDSEVEHIAMASMSSMLSLWTRNPSPTVITNAINAAFNTSLTTNSNSNEFVNDTNCSGLHCDISIWWELLGDFLCLGSAFCQCMTIIIRAKVPDDKVPLIMYTLCTAAVVTIVSTISTLALESVSLRYGGSEDITVQYSQLFCTDNIWCIFGWTSKEWSSVVLMFGFFTGCICVTGFNYAMKNLSPLIFSSMNMLDPVITGLMSWGAGLEGIPAAGVILGGTVVMGGIGLLSVGEKHRADDDHSSDEIHVKFQKLPDRDEDIEMANVSSESSVIQNIPRIEFQIVSESRQEK